jgi:enamine deaminase RidA (YjgF/YER057c/UK114 family)
MNQAYINIQKVLAQYGATMDSIVDEILFVTDMDVAFAAAYPYGIVSQSLARFARALSTDI